VPYEPAFDRTVSHYSHLYWGASLKALQLLGNKKRYGLVGSNSAGNNAFFLRRDCLNGQPELSAEQAYVESRFRESRGPAGNLTYVSGRDRFNEISHLQVWDVAENKLAVLSDYQC
jgi:hypothetical protein